MDKDYLTLKRASASRSSGEWGENDYDVLADGRKAKESPGRAGASSFVSRLTPHSARRIALTSYRASFPPSCFGWSRPPPDWWPFQGRECQCSSTAEK